MAMLGAMRFIWMMVLSLFFAGCMKSTQEVTGNLWQSWQQMDILLKSNYPDAVPVVLVHGWNGSEFTWPDVKKLAEFERKMQRDIYFFTYRTGVVANQYPPIELLANELGAFLSKYPKVDVVAHSMGGLVVRQYLVSHQNSPIRRLLFLSTPHFGTEAASVLETVAKVGNSGNFQADEIQPASQFLWKLNLLKGKELQGVEVLNAFADSESVFERDLVVGPHSAWLPWAANVSVMGDHHTLSAHLMDYDFIEAFLMRGEIPKDLAKQPSRKDLWVKIWSVSGEPVDFTENMLRRMDAELKPRQHEVSVCCKRASSLDGVVQKSFVVEDVQADDLLWFTRRNGDKPEAIKQAGDMHDYVHPVSLVRWHLKREHKKSPKH